MLAYAANRPRVGARQSSPNALLFVICAHIILIAVALSAKMTIAPRTPDALRPLISVPLPQPPPPQPSSAAHPSRPAVPLSLVHQPVQTNRVSWPPHVPASSERNETGPIVGSAAVAIPDLPPLPPVPVPASSSAQLLTAASDLKPPYPETKLLTGEEALLVLRLTIDERGRVVAVDPVGRADPIFLAAARRHLLAHWRYKPATKDGRAIASTTIVSLRFELDG